MTVVVLGGGGGVGVSDDIFSVWNLTTYALLNLPLLVQLCTKCTEVFVYYFCMFCLPCILV